MEESLADSQKLSTFGVSRGPFDIAQGIPLLKVGSSPRRVLLILKGVEENPVSNCFVKVD
jgi:hypothetical protein